MGGLFAVVSECCGGRIKATQARALVCGGGGGDVEDVVVFGWRRSVQGERVVK